MWSLYYELLKLNKQKLPFSKPLLLFFAMTFLFDVELIKSGSLEKRFVTSFNWDVFLLLDITELDTFLIGGVWETISFFLIKFLPGDTFYKIIWLGVLVVLYLIVWINFL